MSWKQKSLPLGILAGVAGGLAASWVMNEFIAYPGKKLSDALETPEEKKQLAEQSDGEDATMKTADALTALATGGRHLTHEQKESAGPIIHYAFGGLMGGLYGAMAEYSPAVRAGFGTTFGAVLFAGADLFAVPALKLGGSATEYPLSSEATPLAAHLVYGATTELIRKLIRAIV
jgi:putative membrane protein